MADFNLNARVAVATIVCCPNGDPDKPTEYLVLKHKRGTWECPGGKLELGENLYQAACRELREEVGEEASLLLPVSEQVVGIYSNGTDDGNTFVFVYFTAITLHKEIPIVLSETEHEDHMWIDKFDLRKLPNKAPRLHAWVEGMQPNNIFHRDVTDKSMFPWYPGEKETVGKCQTTT